MQLQGAGGEGAHGRLVLDQQHGAPALFGQVVRGGGCRCRGRLGRRRPGVLGGKIQGKGRALARNAVAEDVAACLLDDAVGRGKPQAGPFALLLGGEERVEDLVQRLGRDAAALVRDRDAHVFALGNAGPFQRQSGPQADILGADRDLAAAGHGVAGVHDEVHQHLLELPGVGADRPQRGVVRHGDHDPLSDETVEKMAEVGQRVPQVDELRRQRLLAREGEQLAHQGRRPVGVLRDLVQVRIIGVRVVAPQHQKVAMARDRRQQVVEVMRDAARQLADGLHLLALHELRFQRLQRADIRQHRHDAVRSGTCPHRDLQRALGLSGAGLQHLAAAGVAALSDLGDPVAQGAPGTLDQVAQEGAARDRAQQRLRGGIGREHPSRGVEIDQRDGKCQVVEARFRCRF